MYGEKHLVCVQARIQAAGDHLVEITSASGALWRRALEREGRALASRVEHQALDAENSHYWLPRRTREATRRACMSLEASAFSGRGRRKPTTMKSGQDGCTAHPDLSKLEAQQLLLRQ